MRHSKDNAVEHVLIWWFCNECWIYCISVFVQHMHVRLFIKFIHSWINQCVSFGLLDLILISVFNEKWEKCFISFLYSHFKRGRKWHHHRRRQRSLLFCSLGRLTSAHLSCLCILIFFIRLVSRHNLHSLFLWFAKFAVASFL